VTGQKETAILKQNHEITTTEAKPPLTCTIWSVQAMKKR
jgi:hypothetical protein